MKYTIKTITLLSCSVLAACGGSDEQISTTPNPAPVAAYQAGSVVKNADASFTVTQAGETTNLPASNVVFNGQTAWMGGVIGAQVYQGTDVIAIGGSSNGEFFSGISGTQTAVPATGTASYAGRYYASTGGSSAQGPVTIDVDFANAKVTTAATEKLLVDGDISGTGFTGTVTFNGNQADLTGGFYGSNEIAGAFDGDAVAGILYGTK